MLVQLAPLAREQLVLLEDDWLLCEGGWAALQLEDWREGENGENPEGAPAPEAEGVTRTWSLPMPSARPPSA